VKLLWKKLQLGVFAGLTFLATGCGGFHAGYGFSPIGVLIPGLVKVERKTANPENTSPTDDRSKELAQNQTSQINF
jgi:hypothetical protein